MQLKLKFALATAGVVAAVGGVAVVGAAPSQNASPVAGYAQNQCKDPAFLTANGFKNHGACVSFFAKAQH